MEMEPAVVFMANDDNFQQIILGCETPILVDFFASWYIPCKRFSFTLQRLAEEFQTEMKFARVDIDKNRESVTQYGIVNIPTVLLFDTGQISRKFVGYKQEKAIEQNIINYLRKRSR